MSAESENEAIKRERATWQKLFEIYAQSEIDMRTNEIMYLKIIRFALEMDHRSAHDVAELEYLAKQIGLEGGAR